MPKRLLTIKDWSGGMNNRKDPRDIPDNEYSYIQDMSIDSLGKIKSAGGLYDAIEGSDGTTDLTEYIVSRTANILGSGGYGFFYFELSQHTLLGLQEHNLLLLLHLQKNIQLFLFFLFSC